MPSRPFLPARIARVPSGAEARAYDLVPALADKKANDRYKVLMARFGIHSRYAGTICVDNNALVKTRRENLVQSGSGSPEQWAC